MMCCCTACLIYGKLSCCEKTEKKSSRIEVLALLLAQQKNLDVLQCAVILFKFLPGSFPIDLTYKPHNLSPRCCLLACRPLKNFIGHQDWVFQACWLNDDHFVTGGRCVFTFLFKYYFGASCTVTLALFWSCTRACTLPLFRSSSSKQIAPGPENHPVTQYS